jgi:hypothetical protein
VFGGGDQHALLHQAGGVADFGYIAADGLYLEAIQIDPAEDDAASSTGGADAQADWRSAMQADAIALDRPSDCAFIYQSKGAEAGAPDRLQKEQRRLRCFFATTLVPRQHSSQVPFGLDELVVYY